MSCSIQCTNTCAGTVRVHDWSCVRIHPCVCVCVCSYVGVFLMDNVCLSLHSPATVHSLPARDRRLSGRTHGYPQFKTQSQSLFQILNASVGSVLLQELLLLLPSLWRLNVCKIASVFVVLPTYTCKSLILPCTSVCLSLYLSLYMCALKRLHSLHMYAY